MNRPRVCGDLTPTNQLVQSVQSQKQIWQYRSVLGWSKSGDKLLFARGNSTVNAYLILDLDRQTVTEVDVAALKGEVVGWGESEAELLVIQSDALRRRRLSSIGPTGLRIRALDAVVTR